MHVEEKAHTPLDDDEEFVAGVACSRKMEILVRIFRRIFDFEHHNVVIGLFQGNFRYSFRRWIFIPISAQHFKIFGIITLHEDVLALLEGLEVEVEQTEQRRLDSEVVHRFHHELVLAHVRVELVHVVVGSLLEGRLQDPDDFL